MPVILRTGRDLPAPDTWDRWLACTGSHPPLEMVRHLPELAKKLEAAFTANRAEWWELGRRLGSEPSGRLAHAPTAASYNSDLGLMLAWGKLVENVAAETPTTLVVCDDPWVFRDLAGRPGVSAGRAPALWPARLRFAFRGWAARLRYALRAALWSTQMRQHRGVFNRSAGAALLVYGHPASTADGDDAYFGSLMRTQPHVLRLLHTDCPADRARALAADGRTASLHAWSRWRWIPAVLTARWRPDLQTLSGPRGWLVRRAAGIENGGGAIAANTWQIRCQERWMATVRPDRVVWPWENHPWERAFVRAARRAGIATYGYQHTVVGPHQTNFAPATNPDGLESIPDLVVCNGPAYRDQLRGWGLPEERLIIGGAFRIARPAGSRHDPSGPVFVALSSSRPLSNKMMAAVVATARSTERRFVVKDHPLYPYAIAETETVRRTSRTIPEHTGLAAVIYATGTSGMEGLLAGVPTLRFLPDDRIAVDVLPESLPVFPVTAETLGTALTTLPEPPRVAWDALYAPVDEALWQRLLCAAPVASASVDTHMPATRPDSRTVQIGTVL